MVGFVSLILLVDHCFFTLNQNKSLPRQIRVHSHFPKKFIQNQSCILVAVEVVSALLIQGHLMSNFSDFLMIFMYDEHQLILNLWVFIFNC